MCINNAWGDEQIVWMRMSAYVATITHFDSVRSYLECWLQSWAVIVSLAHNGVHSYLERWLQSWAVIVSLAHNGVHSYLERWLQSWAVIVSLAHNRCHPSIKISHGGLEVLIVLGEFLWSETYNETMLLPSLAIYLYRTAIIILLEAHVYYVADLQINDEGIQNNHRTHNWVDPMPLTILDVY